MGKHNTGFLKDACIADKVVGKGAAALMILGGEKEEYADIISLSSLILLREAHVDTHFGRVVPFIYNRDKTGWCPLERLCYNESEPEAIFPLIEDFVNTMKRKEEEEKLTMV